MKIYLQFYRLYLVWFSIGWIIGIYGYFWSASLAGALTVKALLYIILYFTSISRTGKYWCYFQNSGYSISKLYMRTSVVDFAAFASVTSTINLILHA